jgi:hypothetical protein
MMRTKCFCPLLFKIVLLHNSTFGKETVDEMGTSRLTGYNTLLKTELFSCDCGTLVALVLLVLKDNVFVEMPHICIINMT